MAHRDALIFGIHATLAALHAQTTIKTLWLKKGEHNQRLQKIAELAAAQDLVIHWATTSALERIAGSDRHQGVVAEIHHAAPLTEKQLLKQLDVNPGMLALALDGLTDQHNLGACLRVAAAAGAQFVFAPANGNASLSGGAQKAASGGAQHVPFVRVKNLSRTLRQMRDAGLWVVGLDERASTSLFDLDLRRPMILLAGGESSGLRRLSRTHCDYLARLPCDPQMPSLNVSVAAGIALFEARRQRDMQMKNDKN